MPDSNTLSLRIDSRDISLAESQIRRLRALAEEPLHMSVAMEGTGTPGRPFVPGGSGPHPGTVRPRVSGGGLFDGVISGARMAGSVIRTALLAPLRAATTAAKALALGMGATAGAAYGVKKLLDPAGEMQQYAIQLEVLLKNSAQAQARLAQLTRYARETNYSASQVISAANLMESFGIYSFRRLQLAGDAANAFGKDISEIVTSLNYLASGRGGEAFESLSRIGITRDKLKPFGVVFGKSGELKSSSKKALEAVFRYMEQTFGGMTSRMGGTWRGALQQLGGELFDALQRGLKKALGPMTRFVNTALKPLVGSLGDALERADWQRILKKPLGVLRGASYIASEGLGGNSGPMKALGQSLLLAGRLFMDGLGGLAGALLQDTASVFRGIFQSAIPLGKLLFDYWYEGNMLVLRTAVDALKLAFEEPVYNLETVLSRVLYRAGSALPKMLVDQQALSQLNTRVNTPYEGQDPGMLWDNLKQRSSAYGNKIWADAREVVAGYTLYGNEFLPNTRQYLAGAGRRNFGNALAAATLPFAAGSDFALLRDARDRGVDPRRLSTAMDQLIRTIAGLKEALDKNTSSVNLVGEAIANP